MPKSWDDVLGEIAAAEGTVKPDPDASLRWLITRYDDTVLGPPTVLELATHDAFDHYAAGLQSGDPEHAQEYAERGADSVAVDALEMALASFLRIDDPSSGHDGSRPHPARPTRQPLARDRSLNEGNLHWIASPCE